MAVRADDVDLTRDRSLVELCQAGDQGAFGDLYSRYYQRLLRFCIRRVGNVHEAEEITQEAFARAFSAMPRFAGERRFYPWLTVIASRLCVDSHRRGARSEPTAEVDLGTIDGGQQQIIDNVDLSYLATAMNQLGPRHREVLELRETHGWSYQQIADHYNVTMGTVEALLFRARKALKREFLALAGPEARLAGLPLIGAVYRAAAHLRARINDLGVQVAPAAAAGAMSVAAIAGGFAGHSGAAAARPTAPAPTVTNVVNAAVTSAVVGTTVEPDAAAPPAPTVNAAEEEAPPAGAATQSQSGSADAGRDRAADDRAGADIAGFGLATDAANGIGELIVHGPGK